jgi:hypothetical protein
MGDLFLEHVRCPPEVLRTGSSANCFYHTRPTT